MPFPLHVPKVLFTMLDPHDWTHLQEDKTKRINNGRSNYLRPFQRDLVSRNIHVRCSEMSLWGPKRLEERNTPQYSTRYFWPASITTSMLAGEHSHVGHHTNGTSLGGSSGCVVQHAARQPVTLGSDSLQRLHLVPKHSWRAEAKASCRDTAFWYCRSQRGGNRLRMCFNADICTWMGALNKGLASIPTSWKCVCYGAECVWAPPGRYSLNTSMKTAHSKRTQLEINPCEG